MNGLHARVMGCSATYKLVGTATLLLCLAAVTSCEGSREALDGRVPPRDLSVELTTPRPTYSVGETIVARVEIEDAVDVASVPFHLLFDEEVLQFLDATEGDFLSSVGATAFLYGETEEGDVVVGLSSFGSSASGSGVLAVFRFLAIGAGECEFDFSGASVRDPDSRILPATFEAGAVAVM